MSGARKSKEKNYVAKHGFFGLKEMSCCTYTSVE